MNKAILVAGGAGYIGSHVCKTLAKAGYLPVTLDNLVTGRKDFVRFGPLAEASVGDAVAVETIVKKYAIEAVIDLAGSIEVGESVKNPLKYYDNTFAVKIAFLRALRKAGVRAFVFSSTAAVYGEPQAVPIPESHPRQPKNPYGWSKFLVEQMLADYYLSKDGIPWMALRYFNAAGASLDGDIGECHEPESHLIPRACYAALGRGEALEIYGNDYDTPDGTAIRDYIHVMDLASAHVLAVEQLMQGAPPASYNLGNGIGISVGEVMKTFARMGVDVPHSFKGRRAGDPTRLVADSRAAKEKLGWKPGLGDIGTIIRSAYDWHKAMRQ